MMIIYYSKRERLSESIDYYYTVAPKSPRRGETFAFRKKNSSLFLASFLTRINHYFREVRRIAFISNLGLYNVNSVSQILKSQLHSSKLNLGNH